MGDHIMNEVIDCYARFMSWITNERGFYVRLGGIEKS